MSWNPFRRRPRDPEFDREIAFHVEELTRAGIAQGLSLEEARRRAILEFGGREQVKQQVREPPARCPKKSPKPSSHRAFFRSSKSRPFSAATSPRKKNASADPAPSSSAIPSGSAAFTPTLPRLAKSSASAPFPTPSLASCLPRSRIPIAKSTSGRPARPTLLTPSVATQPGSPSSAA